MDNNDALARFYDIMVRAKLDPPPWEKWQPYASAADADLWPICRHGLMIGGVFFKAGTIHVAVAPGWEKRWVTPSILKAWRNIGHPVPLVGHIRADNHVAIELAKRLGFKFKADAGLFHFYVKEPCHAKPE